jgi:hypothetical protein
MSNKDKNNAILDIMNGNKNEDNKKEDVIEEPDIFKYIDMSNETDNDNLVGKTLNMYDLFLSDYNTDDTNNLQSENISLINKPPIMLPIVEKPKKFEFFGSSEVSKRLVANMCSFLHISEYLTMSMVCISWKKIILRITRELSCLEIKNYNDYILTDEDISIYNKKQSFVFPTITARLINHFVFHKKLKSLTLDNVILTPEIITSLSKFNGKLHVLKLGTISIKLSIYHLIFLCVYVSTCIFITR